MNYLRVCSICGALEDTDEYPQSAFLRVPTNPREPAPHHFLAAMTQELRPAYRDYPLCVDCVKGFLAILAQRNERS